MRQWINLIAESYWDTPGNLERYADGYMSGMGASGSELASRPASDFDWRLDPQYPIAKLNGDCPLDSYEEMMRDDIRFWGEDGQPDRFADMFDRPIRDPIIAVEDGDKAHVVDGCHRVGACLMQKLDTVPAVVGVLKKSLNEAAHAGTNGHHLTYLFHGTSIPAATTII